MVEPQVGHFGIFLIRVSECVFDFTLEDTLADETTSEEDAYNARKQLVEIQDEIVSKYGLQKDSIDLVNGSLHILIKSFLYVYSLLYEVGI